MLLKYHWNRNPQLTAKGIFESACTGVPKVTELGYSGFFTTREYFLLHVKPAIHQENVKAAFESQNQGFRRLRHF